MPKLLALTITYNAGDEDYSVIQREISTETALLEITRKAKNSLLEPKDILETSQLSITFYISEDGKIFPFFFGNM